MAQLVLKNIDAETAEKLEVRAKRLGTTPEEEASRLLRERLRGEPHHESEQQLDRSGVDPRFVRKNGFLVFVGTVETDETPDHRALRDERIDSLIEGIDEGRV